MISTSGTDRAFVYVHAIARTSVSLVSQSAGFGGPVTIRVLKYKYELDITLKR